MSISETCIYVGKFLKNIRSSDLEDEFQKFGKIKDFDWRSTHAFIEFDSSKDASRVFLFLYLFFF